MRARRPSSGKSLASAIDEVIETFSLERVRQYDAVTRWNEIVGEQIARVTEPVRIEKGTLIVRVSNGPWRNELTLMKSGILGKVNNALKGEKIRDIRFV